jgi:hypothetical protein
MRVNLISALLFALFAISFFVANGSDAAAAIQRTMSKREDGVGGVNRPLTLQDAMSAIIAG